jgi:hypothetical protein
MFRIEIGIAKVDFFRDQNLGPILHCVELALLFARLAALLLLLLVAALVTVHFPLHVLGGFKHLKFALDCVVEVVLEFLS